MDSLLAQKNANFDIFANNIQSRTEARDSGKVRRPSTQPSSKKSFKIFEQQWSKKIQVDRSLKKKKFLFGIWDKKNILQDLSA